MKSLLNVRWHYYFQQMKSYRASDNNLVLMPHSYFYRLVSGKDSLNLNYLAININRLTSFLKSLPLTSDFIPVNKSRGNECVKNIEVVPGIRFYIVLVYCTLNHENHLSFNITNNNEDSYKLNIIKESYHSTTYARTESKECRIISKEEATNILSKLPETIDLGVFKLPFGNCLECDYIEC